MAISSHLSVPPMQEGRLWDGTTSTGNRASPKGGPVLRDSCWAPTEGATGKDVKDIFGFPVRVLFCFGGKQVATAPAGVQANTAIHYSSKITNYDICSG